MTTSLRIGVRTLVDGCWACRHKRAMRWQAPPCRPICRERRARSDAARELHHHTGQGYLDHYRARDPLEVPSKKDPLLVATNEAARDKNVRS